MSVTFLISGTTASSDSANDGGSWVGFGNYRSSLRVLGLTAALSASAVLFLRDIDQGLGPLAVAGTSGNPGSASFSNSQAQDETASKQTAIEAGRRVGALRIGDTAARAFEVFPKKLNVDQVSEDAECGVEYLWVDLENPGKGNVIVRIKDSKVFQVDSATTRFRLQNGITVLTAPEEVKKKYPGLRAFYLQGTFSQATGGRPLIFWVDQQKGLAFAFAYYPRKRNRYLYEIIVFAPDSEFCPGGVPDSAPEWLELKPYSVELPEN